ncbi:MAG: hypothetical protein ACPG79_08155, partial [Poseidonia sp.]
MGRGANAVWLVTLLLVSLLPLSSNSLMSPHHALDEGPVIATSGASSLTIAFSNGPYQDDDVKG